MRTSKVQLSTRVTERLVGLGLSVQDAETINLHLLDAEERGYGSHGYMRLPAIVTSLEAGGPGGPGSLKTVSSAAAIYDANGEQGIVALTKATAFVDELVTHAGIGIVAARGHRGTTGTMAPHVRTLADRGNVGIAICTSEYAVAPTGGRRAILGTNPIAIGFPADPEPIVTDFATAAWSYGSLRVAMQEGRRIPEGIVLDADGRPSTDPNDADNGCQLPMAGHKGYGLGLAIELLCGPLIGGKAGRDAVSGSDGIVMIALRSDLFREADDVLSDVRSLTAELRQSPLAVGYSSVAIPGERSQKAKNEAAQIAEVIIDDDVLTRAGIVL